ncbi:thiamine phosphate synthase [Plebeiibacterium sediminum]|uniref:Thiamine-phosphate synthase n=1 Tax=Plebeiibacterium sediminum TaxID=2992112 RepID=A0AAE3M2M4_9BACT|nr:thiamine phosphate synthase [Plebeiobacterium sediminum]MCW3785649.1 thiamine phosphate synthase [Plebeiobacterium sediminum]
MEKHISRLHFVTYQSQAISIEKQVMEYCAGGGDWVQLRLKNMEKDEIKSIARTCQSICIQHNATFIINDYVDIAYEIGADGVHLGLNDRSITEARKILGPDKIIGATANTFEHIQKHVSEGADYIGLGPLRFTQTKENLSPVLGFEGYTTISKKCNSCNINIPIIAIGGITPEDITPLFNTGIYGLALSSYLAKNENTGLATIELLTKIGMNQSKLFGKK